MKVVIAVRVCSRQAGHVELAERLVECQYELTDRLAFYLCGRRPGNTRVNPNPFYWLLSSNYYELLNTVYGGL